jgi:glycosyltransferase involved in cell wall biosynthesis
MGARSMFICQKFFNDTSYIQWYNYNKITLLKAFAIFVESEQSKKDLVQFDQIYERKIRVLPLFPGKVIQVKLSDHEQNLILEKWGVEKSKFYFYPAQFWALKNHYGLIMAFKIVIKKYPEFKIVFSGADKDDNLKYIKSIVKRENLENHIIFTGFISNEEVYTFYRNTIALVMPTLLGPTNMPLMEAYHLNCPVICSDFEGHREQLGDYALYADPINHEDIASQMILILNKKNNIEIKPLSNTMSILNDNFKYLYNIRKIFH